MTANFDMKIVSFLPSATEMACALGLADQLVGITHECDYPPEVAGKPIVVRNVLPVETMTQGEIDTAVAARMQEGLSLYQVDEQLLSELAPDLILTQNLCQVCAPSGNEVTQALKLLAKEPQILWLTPRTISEIWENLRDLGAATGRADKASEMIANGEARLAELRMRADSLATRPRVFCMEWLDPIYAAGHWMPEMVKIAGGVDELARPGADSIRVSVADVLSWAPEVLILMPCGFNLEQTVEQSLEFFARSNSAAAMLDLPAVRNRKVYAVDSNSYFARPGPRVVEGTALLAHLIHPNAFEWNGPARAFRRIAL